jgi:Bacteriophage related domain of unknown function
MINNIQAALDTILQDWSAAESIPVSWENLGAETDIDEPHVASFLIPAETDTPAIADDDYEDFTGIYQVSVYVQKGDGTGASRPIVDSLLTAFARGVEKTISGQRTRIVKSWRSGAVDSDAWYLIPVSVRYRSFA